MSFSKKKLVIHIEMVNPRLSVDIKELPIRVEIGKSGLPAMNNAKISIQGLKLDLMQQLTFLSFRTLQVNRNKIAIYADGSLAFSGEITSAFPNFNNAPNVGIDIEAITGYSSKVVNVPPYSQKGNIPVSTIAQDLATKAGFTFVNKGVNVQAVNPHIGGSYVNQLTRLSEDYNFGMTIEDGVVTIFPNEGKSSNVVLNLSKDTGLIGYPSFNQNGIQFTCEFVSGVSIADVIQINSVLPKASGRWVVSSINHRLTSMIPNGDWSTTIQGGYSYA